MSRGRVWRIVAPLVVAAAGVLFVASAGASQGVDLRAGRHTELADLVRAEDRRTRDLTASVEELRAEVDELSAAAGALSPAGVTQDQLLELEGAAGLTAVTGPGVRVTLDDAAVPASLPADASYDDYVVHQQDLEGVINAFWLGGAEAMMIMDQRVVATSAVRCVGNVLILEGRTYGPPFTVAAIGPTASMLQALDESPAVAVYRDWADYLGLGYEVETDPELAIPAYAGSLELQHATAAAP